MTVRSSLSPALILIASLLILSTSVGVQAAPAESRNFTAHLSGGQEVPPADTQAQGQAIFKLSKDGSELEYKLIVANIDDVRMAHIHLAPAGENGSVAAWLYPSSPPPELIPGRFDGVLAEGVITSSAVIGGDLSDLVEAMRSGNAYVNVHTVEFGGGEIRGQID